MPISKEELLSAARVLPHGSVEVPEGTIDIRGLSRAEVVQMRKEGATVDDMEVATLVAGMVDPSLTEEEVRQWRNTRTSDEIERVSDAILDLSGMLPDSQHNKERTFRPESGEG
ncbi:MAG TPA: hypothetical protein VK988_03100 [Acidimicrobiales bacterium]|nr:hypothetical protein [Acidimicrobiales bacterium]